MRQEGSVLVFTLILLLILFVLGFAFLSSTGGDYLFAGKTRANLQAYFLAQSGLIYATGELENISDINELNGIERELSTGKFKLTVGSPDPANPNIISIKSIGISGLIHKAIEAKLDVTEGVITEWHQR